MMNIKSGSKADTSRAWQMKYVLPEGSSADSHSGGSGLLSLLL